MNFSYNVHLFLPILQCPFLTWEFSKNPLEKKPYSTSCPLPASFSAKKGGERVYEEWVKKGGILYSICGLPSYYLPLGKFIEKEDPKYVLCTPKTLLCCFSLFLFYPSLHFKSMMWYLHTTTAPKIQGKQRGFSLMLLQSHILISK